MNLANQCYNILPIEVFNRIKITTREKQVLSRLARGLTDVEISQELFISPNTVQTHRRKLLNKFDAKNSCILIYYSCKLGIL